MFKRDPEAGGAMVLVVTFAFVALLIAGTITSYVLAGNSNAREANTRQEMRLALPSVLETMRKNLGTQSTMVQEYADGVCAENDKSMVNSRLVAWKYCLTPERFAGEGPSDGMKAVITLTGKSKTRYYRAHLTGLPMLNAKLANTFTQKGWNGWFSDGAGSRFGFTTTSRLDINSGSGLYTYNAVGASNVVDGAPIMANSFALPTAQTQTALRLTGDTVTAYGAPGDANPVSCIGAGCATTPFKQMDGYLTPYTFYDALPTTPDCTVTRDFQTSKAANATLNLGTNGVCYSNVVFDQNTTITGTGLLRMQYPGLITVSEGVKVNINSTFPDSRNLVIVDGLGNNSQANVSGINFVMEPGSSFAGRVVAHSCYLDNATFYGSLSCLDGIYASNITKLYWQQELLDTPVDTHISGAKATESWVPFNLRSAQFDEVTQAGATS